jgi:hypothetical protein
MDMDQIEILEMEIDEILELWFSDADPSETRFAERFEEYNNG